MFCIQCKNPVSVPALCIRRSWSMSVSDAASLISCITLSTSSFTPKSATTHRVIRPALPARVAASSAWRSRSLSPDRATKTNTDPGLSNKAISLAKHRPNPLDAPVMMQTALPKSIPSEPTTSGKYSSCMFDEQLMNRECYRFIKDYSRQKNVRVINSPRIYNLNAVWK